VYVIFSYRSWCIKFDGVADLRYRRRGVGSTASRARVPTVPGPPSRARHGGAQATELDAAELVAEACAVAARGRVEARDPRWPPGAAAAPRRWTTRGGAAWRCLARHEGDVEAADEQGREMSWGAAEEQGREGRGGTRRGGGRRRGRGRAREKRQLGAKGKTKGEKKREKKRKGRPGLSHSVPPPLLIAPPSPSFSPNATSPQLSTTARLGGVAQDSREGDSLSPWQTTTERAKRGSKNVGGTCQQARAFS